MKNPPKHLVKLLWEYDIENLSIDDFIVLERILSFGDMDDIEYVGLANLRDFFISNQPILDVKSHNFWSVICDIEKITSPKSMYDLINHPETLRSFR